MVFDKLDTLKTKRKKQKKKKFLRFPILQEFQDLIKFQIQIWSSLKNQISTYFYKLKPKSYQLE